MGLRLVSGSQNEREEDPNAKKGIMRREQRTGWIPREGTVRHSVDVQGRPFALRINSTGQRGPELEGRQPRKRRLLFLGDSFTMASQTREEDTFTARIDSLLNATTGVPVEVINSGVEGYSTYQELAYYRYYGRVFQPDIVVLCFLPATTSLTIWSTPDRANCSIPCSFPRRRNTAIATAIPTCAGPMAHSSTNLWSS